MKIRVLTITGLSLFLCLQVCFCAEAKGLAIFEKEGQIYLIQSAEDMRTLAQLVNRNEELEPGVKANTASYRLTSDIDLSAYCTGEEGWEPIGYRDIWDDSLDDILWEKIEESGDWATYNETDAGYFNGTFDGDGHVITGLYVNRPQEQAQGLFGGRMDLRGKDPDSEEYQSRETTIIKNLYIKDCDITGSMYTGGIMGGIGEEACCVRNSYMIGSVAGYDRVGGITGMGACLTGCYTRADVTGYSRTGGLIGDIQSMNALKPEGSSRVATIQNCLMGGYRMEREAERDTDVFYPTKDRYNGYIYGFPGAGIDKGVTSAFYYREGLVTEGFGRGMYEFSDWNCKPYDCENLEETDFKELLERPEENWSDVWMCGADYAWPNLAWEKDSRFRYQVTVTVQERDSLWKIADKVYGDGNSWKQIYEQNKERIGDDENRIFPGMDLEMLMEAIGGLGEA